MLWSMRKPEFEYVSRDITVEGELPGAIMFLTEIAERLPAESTSKVMELEVLVQVYPELVQLTAERSKSEPKLMIILAMFTAWVAETRFVMIRLVGRES